MLFIRLVRVFYLLTLVMMFGFQSERSKKSGEKSKVDQEKQPARMSENTSDTFDEFSHREVDVKEPQENIEMSSDFGLIGLAVMGANLARNIASREYQVSVYNRTSSKTEDFLRDYGSKQLVGQLELEDFVISLKKPRKIIIMVKAGEPVQKVIDQLLPYLEKGDVLIDAGNSNFHSTIKRYHELKERGIRYLGCGVSGGEEGALNGPSLMPGGERSAWKELQPMLEKIAARDFSGGPCVSYIGEDGAGHYVKMVHNGIEYGVMQLMAEAYDLLRQSYSLSASEIADVFAAFQKGKLNSYLFEIVEPVLRRKDDFGDGHLIDQIMDQAGQKGTGKWTAVDALNRGVGLSSVSEAVFARFLSSEKPLRQQLSKQYSLPTDKPELPLEELKPVLENGLYAAMISCYAQGYHLIQRAGQEQQWQIDLGEISRIWEGGCIIRAKLLNFLHQAYQQAGSGDRHLLSVRKVQQALSADIPALRKLVSTGVLSGVPMPALSTALSYVEIMGREKSSANLIQGLRDFFGAHTYQRLDREGVFHTQWGENQAQQQ